VGEVKNIYFNNIKCTSENGVYVSAESNDKISNIFFDNVDLFIDKTTSIEGGVYDRRPSKVDGFVKGSTSGFYFDAAKSITVRNCSVQWGAVKPDYFAYVIESKNVDSLKLVNVAGVAAFPEKLKAIKE
jgi:hypothetical protein